MRKGTMKSNFIILISIVLLSTGCKYNDIEIKDVKNVKLGKTSTKEVVIKAEVELVNPNNYKLKIKEYDLDIKINGRDFLLHEDNAGIKIPRKYHGSIPVSLSLKKRGKGVFSFDTLLLFAEVLKSGSVNLEAHGYVKAGVFIFSKSIDVNEKRILKF
jgi:LEA14-like dessication related protein